MTQPIRFSEFKIFLAPIPTSAVAFERLIMMVACFSAPVSNSSEVKSRGKCIPAKTRTQTDCEMSGQLVELLLLVLLGAMVLATLR